MSTLIIGCGYLGQHVAAQLQRRDERVHGTVRSPGRAAAIAALGIEPIIADVLAPESLIGLPRVERIVYCVGFDRAAGSSIQAVMSTASRTCWKVWARLPHGWSMQVQRACTARPRVNGSMKRPRPFPAIHRARRVWRPRPRFRRGSVPVANQPRPSSYVSPGSTGRDVPSGRSVLERGDPIPGDSLKFLNLIHIEDAAQAVVAALFVDQPEPLYLVSDDRPVTRQEYYSRMAALLHAPAPRFVPPHPGSPEAARDASNKRVANNLAKKSLGVVLSYPDITTGLTTCAEP